MDERVDEDEDPDGSRHVAHAGPHAHHGAGMVVGLEGGAELPLGEDDEGIQDLVELAEVEDPAVKGEALVPEPAVDLPAGCSVAIQKRGTAKARPLAEGVAVDGGVSEAGRAVHLAEAVGRGGQSVGARGADDGAPHASEHAPEGPGGVDGEEEVVHYDEDAERLGLADGPGPLAVGGIVAVEQRDSDGVQGGDGDRDLGVEHSGIDVVWDLEG